LTKDYQDTPRSIKDLAELTKPKEPRKTKKKAKQPKKKTLPQLVESPPRQDDQWHIAIEAPLAGIRLEVKRHTKHLQAIEEHCPPPRHKRLVRVLTVLEGVRSLLIESEEWR